MRRRIAKGQGGGLHFSEFEISVREAVQRIEKFGVFIEIEHAVREHFIDPSVQGPDDRLIANLDIGGQPLLKELDFGLVDSSVRGDAARQPDQLVDLPRRNTIAADAVVKLIIHEPLLSKASRTLPRHHPYPACGPTHSCAGTIGRLRRS